MGNAMNNPVKPVKNETRPQARRESAPLAPVPVNFSLCAFVIALCIAVAGCTATKTLERKPAQETASLEESADEDAMAEPPETTEPTETAAYPEQVAGTVRELYGDSSELEQRQAYRDAVDEDPLLRYIIVYFDFNRVELKPASREVLMQHADYLSENPDVEISLEGHADRRGSAGYNLALGERRALAVKNFLRANGVQALQMSVISYGEERPAVEGGSEEAHAKNRRVEIIYK